MDVLLILEMESQVEVLLVFAVVLLVSQVRVLLVSHVDVLLILEMGSQVEVLLVFAVVLLLKRSAASPSASARTHPASESSASQPPAEICG